MSNKEYCLNCFRTKEEAILIKFSETDPFFLCEHCIKNANGVLDKFYIDRKLLMNSKESKKSSTNDFLSKYRPKKIKENLDKYIIAQDDAKKTIAVAVYNHYKRVFVDGLNVDKSNILILGPSGTGKTEIARRIAKMLNVPFAIADATTLTESGYVGDDVENILLKLIKNADYDIERAQRGIIYIDEIDKIARKGQNTSITRDVSGEGVQQALLKIIEGSESVRVPMEGGRKRPDSDCYEIDTSNILFIAAGAFDGIDDIIKQENKIGINSNVAPTVEDDGFEYKPEDLIKFGMVREFVGRFPVITHTKALTKQNLIDVLTKPEDALTKQYKALLKVDNIELDFDDKFLEEIAQKAIERGTGARGLRSEIENSLKDIMYEAPENKKKKVVKITSLNCA